MAAQPDMNPVEMDQEEEVRLINEEYKTWKKNTPFLYDLAMTHALEWPSLTVQWLPSKKSIPNQDYSEHKLILGTHTSGGEQNYLMHARVKLPNEETELDARKYDDESGELGGFTGSAPAKVEVIVRISHEGEVNKTRYMPQDEFVVATKTTSGEVHVFDVTKHPSVPAKDQPSQPQVRCLGHSGEGYAIDWSAVNKGQIVSGADDGSICRWDLGSLSRDSAATADAIVKIPNAHQGATEDVQWHPSHEFLFASCGDDGMLRYWDTRVADPCRAAQEFKAHEMEANALSFAPAQEYVMVTGSSDKTIKLWDIRQNSRALHVLEGHTDEVLNIKWAPFSEAVLASGGADRRVMVWDLSRIGQEQTEEDKEDGPPELLFIHGGHTTKINDLSWNMQDPWVMASVAEDNILQVWKMAENIIVDDDDEIAVGSGGNKKAKSMEVDGVRPSSPTDADLE